MEYVYFIEKQNDDMAATIDNIEIVPDCEVEGHQSYQQRKQKYQRPRQKLIGNPILQS